MNKKKPHQQNIWFRNPMVWFIILLPLFVVIASIITIVIAYKNAPIILSMLLDKTTHFHHIV